MLRVRLLDVLVLRGEWPNFVILPVLNEEGKIGNTVKKVLGDVPEGVVNTVLVVNDGSTDGTEKEAEEVRVQALKNLREEKIEEAKTADNELRHREECLNAAKEELKETQNALQRLERQDNARGFSITKL